MQTERTLDEKTVRDIAKALIMAPLTVEADTRYQRIQKEAPEDFTAIKEQVRQLLVSEDFMEFGGVEGLSSESYEWILANIRGISFKTKTYVLQRAIQMKKASLIRLSMDRFSDLELSQHTSIIENLVHEIEKGAFDNELKEIARHIRNKANEVAVISAENWGYHQK